MSKKTLSLDLRERVVAAVSDGMSRRQAAERFGVSAASAIRWCAREKETGSPAAGKRGGDRWSARIDAHKGLAGSQRLAHRVFRRIALLQNGGGYGLGPRFARHGTPLRRRATIVQKAPPTQLVENVARVAAPEAMHAQTTLDI